MTRNILILLSLFPYQASVASAQAAPAARECGQASTIPFARVAMRRLCALADKPEVRAATGATDAMTLLASAPSDAMWRIPDAALLAFATTFSQSLGSVPDSVCADIYPRPGSASWNQRFMAVAEAIDSATSERWADLLEAWVWTGIHKTPPQLELSPAEAAGHIRTQASTLTTRERQDMTRLAKGLPIPAAAACHAVRASFQVYSSGSSATAAAALRALMHGHAAWFVAT